MFVGPSPCTPPFQCWRTFCDMLRSRRAFQHKLAATLIWGFRGLRETVATFCPSAVYRFTCFVNLTLHLDTVRTSFGAPPRQSKTYFNFWGGGRLDTNRSNGRKTDDLETRYLPKAIDTFLAYLLGGETCFFMDFVLIFGCVRVVLRGFLHGSQFGFKS